MAERTGGYNRLDGVLSFPIDPSYGLTFQGESVLAIRRQVRNRVKGKFEDWLQLSARKRVFYLRNQMAPEEYRESMQAVQTSSSAGLFDWGGEAMRSALKDISGMAQIVSLLAVDAGQVTVTPSLVLQILQDEKHPLPIGEAVMEIAKADPNFILPPLRDRLTGEALDTDEDSPSQNAASPTSGMPPKAG